MPDADAPKRKQFRVGYFVTVDVMAYHESEAGIVGEAACGWPGDWSPPRDPVPVEGTINDHRVVGSIVRSQAMMVKEMDT